MTACSCQPCAEATAAAAETQQIASISGLELHSACESQTGLVAESALQQSSAAIPVTAAQADPDLQILPQARRLSAALRH